MPVAVHGLRELERAFRVANKELVSDLRDVLAEAAQPVRMDSQTLAGSAIRNVAHGDPWAQMRVGVAKSVAYVAPVERGVKTRAGRSPRARGYGTGPPTFADLMMNRAMEPALQQNERRVRARFEQLLDDVTDVWERA